MRSRWDGVGDLWHSKHRRFSTFFVSMLEVCPPCWDGWLYSGVWNARRMRSSLTFAGRYATRQLLLIGTLWHWSHPPGGGMLLHVTNIAHPAKVATATINVRILLISLSRMI